MPDFETEPVAEKPIPPVSAEVVDVWADKFAQPLLSVESYSWMGEFDEPQTDEVPVWAHWPAEVGYKWALGDTLADVEASWANPAAKKTGGIALTGSGVDLREYNADKYPRDLYGDHKGKGFPG